MVNRTCQSVSSVTALNPQTRRGEGLRQFAFDARSLAALDVLQMHSRPREHFDAPFQYTARRANTGLVLIETLRRTVLAHTDINAIRPIPIAEIQKNQVDIRSPLGSRLKFKRDFVDRGQPVKINNRHAPR